MSRSHPVSIPADPAPLAGTLLFPDGGGPHPALLLWAGSGPVDRDGNLPGLHNDSLRLLAEALARRGVATLRTDKRGVGWSHKAGADEARLSLDLYAADAARWLQALRDDAHVSRAGLLGHSEGALIATLAAQRVAPDRLVLLAGLGTPAGPAILRQLAEGGTPPELVEAARSIIVRLLRGEAATDVPAPLAGLFRPSVQPYVASWLLRDPVEELTRVRCPVLVVGGTADLQVRATEARMLAGACPGARLLMIAGMNHVLKAPAEGRRANLQTYSNLELPLAPGLAEGIATFMLS